MAVALALRLTTAVQLEHSWYGLALTPDESTYDTWARFLVLGNPRHIHSLSPLPAYVLAAAYWAVAPVHLVGRLLNVAFGLGQIVLVYLAARELGGRTTAAVSAMIVALYRPFVLFDASLLKEPLGLLLFAALLYLFLLEHRTSRPWRALLLGVTAGLLLNVRQNAGAALVVLLPVLLWRERRRRSRWAAARLGSLVIAGALVATAPFMVMNLRGTGRASPLPLGGFDLYLGNHLDGARPYYSPVPFASTHPDHQGVEFTLELSRRLRRTLSQSEASDLWAMEVLRAAWAEPGRFARRLGDKAVAAVSAHEEADNHDLDVAREFIGTMRLPLVPFWLIMPLGMAGLLLLARRDGRAAALLGVLLAYGASMVLVFSNMRIRAPLVLILVPCAVEGLRWALRRRWGARAGFAALTLGFAALEALPVRATPDATGPRNQCGGGLLARGDREGALEQWVTSASLGGVYSGMARISIATRLAEPRGDLAGARAWLEQVPDDSVSVAAKYAALGRILEKQGHLREAAAALERSISVNGAALEARRDLLRLYRTVAPDRLPRAQAEYQHTRAVYGDLASNLPE